jgi:HK97 family phage major capsid protein/HK97 family phage prohead protease
VPVQTLQRAYSLLEVKSVDKESRVITGIASTPETDRVGDILESKGAEFKLPIPLLWQHDHQQPIGEVFSAKVTSAGIEVKARIASISEPGRLKDRVDEAYQAMTHGLVRGLSVGFSPIEVEPIKGTYGYRFLKWLWLELSAVTIPANAQASITAIKSFDIGRPAAIGKDARVSSTPGVTGRQGMTSMTISEKVTARKADLKTKSERLEQLINKSDDAVLEASELEERDTLTEEVRSLNGDIASLEVLEASRASFSKPVGVVRNFEEASQSRMTFAPHVEVKSTLPPGIEFTRYVKCKMAGLKHHMSPMEIARTWYPDFPRIQALIKAEIAGHNTTDATSAGPLVEPQTLVSEFIDFLRPQTVVGKFGTGNVPSLNRVPFNVRITGQTSGGTGYWVGQGQPKPLTKYDFSAITLGFSKVAAITVQTEELARFSSPSSDMLLRNALAGSLIERLDIDFINPDKALVANVSPASITNGIAGLTPSGTDAASFRADVQQLLAGFIAANIAPTSGVLIMTPTTALSLSLMRNALGQSEFPNLSMMGGTIEGFPVIVSNYAALTSLGSPGGNILIMVNADDIFLADDGGVTIDASREASLEMSDTPTNASTSTASPPDPTPTSVVSMYQTNSIALRAERFINWQRRRDAAVAWLEGVAYTAGSPA